MTSLLGNQYSEVISLRLLYEIWKALDSNYEGDRHAKKVRWHNWICLFQECKMMEDEYVRIYFGIIS